MNAARRSFVTTVLMMLALAVSGRAGQADALPVRVGFDGAFSVLDSTSAPAIERGLRVAIREINDAGGVLGGRPLELVVRDNRSVPARAIENLRELAALPDLVAVFTGRYSPVVLELVPVAHELGLILLDPWASADAITDNGHVPNYVFRLSLRDSYAMPAMLRYAESRGLRRVGLMLPSTTWGRSNLAAARRHFAGVDSPVAVGVRWHSWGMASLRMQYESLRRIGAEAIILVANAPEAAVLVREVAALPEAERLPIISHWGVTGAQFYRDAAAGLRRLDFTLIQTFSLLRADPERLARMIGVAQPLYGLSRVEDFEAPSGFGQAYDLMHLLARAISQAGTTDRAAVRNALEHLGPYRGLIRDYDPPFTPDRHDALEPQDAFMARYREDGVLIPVDPATSRP